MAHLIYSALASLDGYIEDPDGKFDWAAPDEEVHKFVNDLERTAGTHLYGRRMYETMQVWETELEFTADSALLRDYAAIWQAADKIVYSTTLRSVSTLRTRIERHFDADTVRRLKETAKGDISIGGADIAARAFRSGLVDEIQLFLVPVLVGGGKKALPDGVRLELELMDEHRFTGGVVFLRYRAVQGGSA